MVPRFLAALGAAGARPHRVDAYLTTLGATPESCSVEAWMLMSGHIHAIALSSTAEVSVCFHTCCEWPCGRMGSQIWRQFCILMCRMTV